MPLTTRMLALRGEVPVSPLFRHILRALLARFQPELPRLDPADRIAVYEQRDRVYLCALAHREALFHTIAASLEEHFLAHGADPRPALQVLQLDRALCPRMGTEHSITETFSFDARSLHDQLAGMDMPTVDQDADRQWSLDIHHPGGVGEILHVADGGSWLRGVILEDTGQGRDNTSAVQFVAIA